MDKFREIFKYNEFADCKYLCRWLYDRKKGYTVDCKDRKLYCVNCNACRFAHTVDQRNKYKSSMPDQIARQSNEDKTKRVKTGYELKFTPTQVISLLLIDWNCSYFLVDGVYIPKFLL
jgi:hypothetical protein